MIRISQVLFWLGLSISVVTALYYTSDRTRELNHQLREINADDRCRAGKHTCAEGRMGFSLQSFTG